MPKIKLKQVDEISRKTRMYHTVPHSVGQPCTFVNNIPF